MVAVTKLVCCKTSGAFVKSTLSLSLSVAVKDIFHPNASDLGQTRWSGIATAHPSVESRHAVALDGCDINTNSAMVLSSRHCFQTNRSPDCLVMCSDFHFSLCSGIMALRRTRAALVVGKKITHLDAL